MLEIQVLMCMVSPSGVATARWRGFEQRNNFFNARRSRAARLPEVISPKTLQPLTARGAYVWPYVCHDAHLGGTGFPPYLGHTDRMMELLALEIGWTRTAWERGDPIYPCETMTRPEEVVR